MQLPKIPFGVPSLDGALDGGVNPGTLIILVGRAHSGKKVFAEEFFYNGLANNEASVYVITDDSAESLMNQMATHSKFLTQFENQYKFVDAFSMQGDPNLEDTSLITYVSSPADISNLAHAIMEIIGKKMAEQIQLRLIIDSLTAMLSFLDHSAVTRFLYYLKSKVRATNSACLILLDSEAHDPKVCESLMHLADMSLVIDADKSQLILKRHGTERKAPLKSEEGNLEIGEFE
jgi:KaiC/GvpD/RAD55 family RecA-like ATPase